MVLAVTSRVVEWDGAFVYVWKSAVVGWFAFKTAQIIDVGSVVGCLVNGKNDSRSTLIGDRVLEVLTVWSGRDEMHGYRLQFDSLMAF